jgi:hypothetical protein
VAPLERLHSRNVTFAGEAAGTRPISHELAEDEAAKARTSQGVAILAIGVAFFLADLGDKTLLATVTLATQEGWLGTWSVARWEWSPPTPSPSWSAPCSARSFPENVIKSGGGSG